VDRLKRCQPDVWVAAIFAKAAQRYDAIRFVRRHFGRTDMEAPMTDVLMTRPWDHE